MIPDDVSLREGRDAYFRANGFSESGYLDRWVSFKVGPLRFRIPNTQARVAAVRRHDLHHVLTGYEATWTGEAEIAAWELASGCRSFHAAWILNIAAAAIGLVIAPGAVAKAWRKGMRESNLYSREWTDAWLERKVGDMRRELCIKDA
jgi:hypothetical protein